MRIEKARPEDLAAILFLQKLAYQSEAELCNDDTIPPLMQTLDGIQEDYRKQLILKAVAQEEIIGSVRAFAENGVCHIGRLIVHPDHQNQGIGKVILRAIEESFGQCAKYALFTGKHSSRNVSFYQKMGYQIAGEERMNDKVTIVFLEKQNERPGLSARQTERFLRQIEFIIEIDKLKQVLRNTILFDASRRENDAEHSWHMALAAVILMEYSNCAELDINRVVKMALIHDLVELDAGDVFAYDNVNREEIQAKERKAAARIFGMLPPDQAEELSDLWNEFEAGITAEARFTQALDSFMPALHNYKTQGIQWQRHGITAERVLARNRRIENGSEPLWNYIQTMVQDAVDKGYLKEK